MKLLITCLLVTFIFNSCKNVDANDGRINEIVKRENALKEIETNVKTKSVPVYIYFKVLTKEPSLGHNPYTGESVTNWDSYVHVSDIHEMDLLKEDDIYIRPSLVFLSLRLCSPITSQPPSCLRQTAFSKITVFNS